MTQPGTEASALQPPAGERLEPLRVRAAPAPVAMPWGQRLRELISSFMPILAMLALALASWWLVKNSPQPIGSQQDRPLRTDPDYTMSRFALERFAADGRLKLRIEGDELRHIPATDRIEIDGVRIRATTADGRVTLASARQALAAGDGSEVQLLGGAQVDTVDAQGVPLEMRGEFLHAFLDTEKVKSHLPVQVRHGGTQINAAGLLYDHARQRLDLTGPTRTVLQPRAVRP
jgi:lipopolysaccharide export system protein LptC